MKTRVRSRPVAPIFPKAPTGIAGLDEITGGGLPRGRPTLVCGGPGCGKTLLALEFLVRGATQFGEPGVFIAFEESAAELTQNVASLGMDLAHLIARRQLAIDFVRLDVGSVEAVGEWDLDGLFVRIDCAIKRVRARRIVLDSVECLFGSLTDSARLRAELQRLFRWLKERGVTAIITGERDAGGLTRHGLEEYVSDCAIVLDHRVIDQISTRRLRVAKYRGSRHETNEYPFLIGERGLSVLPITSAGLQHTVSTARVSSGVGRLDRMLGGGFFRGSSVLLSGTAGTGKTTLAAHIVTAACARGERCLYFAFEESPAQIERNQRSVGLKLARHVRAGTLRFVAGRPTACGLEMHLLEMQSAVDAFAPCVVVIDPITAFVRGGNAGDVQALLVRLIDHFKARHITAVLTSLTPGGAAEVQSSAEVSSLIDTWILLRDVECNGEYNRSLNIIKSRGMAHSNQLREFTLTRRGLELHDVYAGPGGVLTGSARLAQEARENAAGSERAQEIVRLRRSLSSKRDTLTGQLATLRENFATERAETQRRLRQLQAGERDRRRASIVQHRSRQAD